MLDALIQDIDNSIAQLGCIVSSENVNEVREAIRTLCACKEQLQSELIAIK